MFTVRLKLMLGFSKVSSLSLSLSLLSEDLPSPYCQVDLEAMKQKNITDTKEGFSGKGSLGAQAEKSRRIEVLEWPLKLNAPVFRSVYL